MRKFTDLIKAIAIIALIAILIGAVAKLFVPSEDVETLTPDESIVETLPDSSKPEASKPEESESDTSGPEESEPDASEPEVSDEVYLDVILHDDIQNYPDLNVEKLADGSLKINGNTSSHPDKPFAFIVDMSELYDEFGSGYYVLSYEVVSQGNVHTYEFNYVTADLKPLTEEPQVFNLYSSNCYISFTALSETSGDPGVIDLIVRFKGMYVTEEYINFTNLY